MTPPLAVRIAAMVDIYRSFIYSKLCFPQSSTSTTSTAIFFCFCSCRDNPDGDRRDGKKQKRSKKEKKKHKKSSSSSKRERDERASQSPPPYSDEDIKYNKTNREPDSRDRHTDSRGRYNTSPNRKRPRDGSDKNNDVGKYVSNGSGRETLEPTWLRNNIRVRVVHKSYAGGRAYLGKGTVVDVPCVGEATVSMDLGSLVLEGNVNVLFLRFSEMCERISNREKQLQLRQDVDDVVNATA